MNPLTIETSKELEENREKKGLEIMVLASILVHILLIYMILPQFKAPKMFQPPKRRVVIVRDYRPPKKKPKQQDKKKTEEPKKRKRVVPVPDATPDEPEEEYEFEPEPEFEDIMIPDDALVIFGDPEAPPPPDAIAPLRITGDVRAPVELKQVRPIYPDLAKRAGIEGIVIIEAVIDKSGDVIDARILRGIPKSGCDEAAIEAVLQWKYKPATLNGTPVDVFMTVTVTFELN